MLVLIKWLKRLIALIFAVFSILLGMWIANSNGQLVSLTLFNWVSRPYPLGLIICTAFFLGVIGGMLVSIPSYLSHRSIVASLKRKLSRRDKELSHLRTAPLRD